MKTQTTVKPTQEEKDKPQTLKTFQCWIDRGCDSERYATTHIAKTPAAARYAFYRQSDFHESYAEMFKHIKSRSLGTMRPEHFFDSEYEFNRMKEYRGIQFAYMGMVVDVSGQKGWITGKNYGMNLDVLFEGRTSTCNCHPYNDITYYDKDMNVLFDYKLKKEANNNG